MKIDEKLLLHFITFNGQSHHLAFYVYIILIGFFGKAIFTFFIVFHFF